MIAADAAKQLSYNMKIWLEVKLANLLISNKLSHHVCSTESLLMQVRMQCSRI